MSIASKFLVLAVMALVVMAFGASTGSAEPVEAVTEGDTSAQPCIPSCDLHAAGESLTTFQQHVFGSESTFTSCQDEFRAEIRHLEDPVTEDFGHVYHYENNHTVNPQVCPRINCYTPSEHEWELRHAEEAAIGVITFGVILCLRTETGADTHCEIPVTLIDDGDHAYELRASVDNGCALGPGVSFEVNSHWNVEPRSGGVGAAIEFLH